MESVDTTEQTGLLQQLNRGQISAQQSTKQALTQLSDTAKTLVCTGATPEVQKFSTNSLQAIKDKVLPAMLDEHNADVTRMETMYKTFDKAHKHCDDEFAKARLESEQRVEDLSTAHKVCREKQLETCTTCKLCQVELENCTEIAGHLKGRCDSNIEKCDATNPASCAQCGDGNWGMCKDSGAAEPKCAVDEIETVHFGSFTKQIKKSSECTWEAKRWAESYLKVCQFWWVQKKSCKNCTAVCDAADFDCNAEHCTLEDAATEAKAGYDRAKLSCEEEWNDTKHTYLEEKEKVLKRAEQRKEDCNTLEATECLLKHIKETAIEMGHNKPCNGTVPSCTDFKNNCSRFDITVPDPPNPPEPPTPPLTPCTNGDFEKHHDYPKFQAESCYKFEPCNCADPTVPPPPPETTPDISTSGPFTLPPHTPVPPTPEPPKPIVEVTTAGPANPYR